MTSTNAAPSQLSPVKQALAEIRRLRGQLAAREKAVREPVAVVGLSFRFPGVESNPAALHESLCHSLDAIGEIPATRWDVERYYAPAQASPGRMYTRQGGFLLDVAGFDPEFFGISPLEAHNIDPQQRLLLECTWEALEHAGIPPTELRGTRAGVFTGMAANDYARLALRDPERIGVYASTGTAFSVASGRVSYLLGLQGPAISVDTACSSSLVAVHLACQSLRSGESDLALAAGVNLILSPELTINFCQAGMLSRDGHCKTFDAAADGYVRSEGCGVVVLKRLSDAQRAGDRILAVIRGSAVNQDGRSSGLTAPNGPAQEAVLRAALKQAELRPSEVGYLEAHGTGTSLGDPIEMQAIGAVYGSAPREQPLWVGSLKTNLGHLEAAAGIAGLIKCVLALQAKQIPPHLHFQRPSPHIPWERIPVAIPTAPTPFPVSGTARRAGVSSFGFSGTNAHVILEEAAEVSLPQADEQAQDRPLHLLTLSAPQESALRVLATRYMEHLATSRDCFADICHTAAVGRAHFPQRLALIASTAAEARDTLQSWLEGDYTPRLKCGSADAVARRFVKIGEAATPDDGETLWLATPEEGEPWTPLLEELARLYVDGAEIDWRGLDRGLLRRRASLPTYPFQRRRFWLDEVSSPTPLPARPAPAADPSAVWRHTEQAALERAELAPLDLNLATYPAKWQALAELTREIGRNALATLGAFPAAGAERDVKGVLAATGIRRLYTPVVGRWLEALSDAGALERTASGYRAQQPLAPADLAPLWRRAEALLADNAPLLDYLSHAAPLTTEVITGRTNPLETLFPGGSFELASALYERSTVLRYVNGVAAAALAAHVEGLPTDDAVRVLELGAGTGGTTGSLLRVLPPERTRYLFTDVSAFFFDHAQEKFATFPFVESRLFDLEQDSAAQGLEPGSFEVIVGSNVVHAVRDLRTTLERLRALLAPGGLLLLVESTGHLAWHDISTGLIEGWQHFEDDLRSDTPLLSPERWLEVLRECGFEETVAAPGPGSPAGILKQHVLLARAPGVATAAGVVQASAPEPAQSTAAAATPAAAAPEGPNFAEQVAGVSEAEREELATGVVRECVMEILHSDPSRPPGRDARLMELGLDSLMAVRFRNLLQQRLRLETPLPSTLVFDYPTIRRIARLVLSRVAPMEVPEAREAPRAEPATPGDREVEIAALSDAAVEALLLRRLEAEEPR